jgi:hypothetical protein
MNRTYLSILFILLVLVIGCATVPTKDIQIDAQADPKANFSGYQTYAWLGAAAIVNDPRGQWEPPSFDADTEIMFLIDSELRKRGMSETTTDPDLVVAYAAGIDMEALGLKVDPKTKMDVVKNVPQGGIVTVLIDSQSGFVIWVGVATGEVRDNPDAKTAKARLDYAVTQMFKRLPK